MADQAAQAAMEAEARSQAALRRGAAAEGGAVEKGTAGDHAAAPAAAATDSDDEDVRLPSKPPCASLHHFCERQGELRFAVTEKETLSDLLLPHTASEMEFAIVYRRQRHWQGKASRGRPTWSSA